MTDNRRYIEIYVIRIRDGGGFVKGKTGKKDKKRMRLRGIEPPHAAPEATALSTELQTHLLYNTIFSLKLQVSI